MEHDCEEIEKEIKEAEAVPKRASDASSGASRESRFRCNSFSFFHDLLRQKHVPSPVHSSSKRCR
jgi:hypothetical protein